MGRILQILWLICFLASAQERTFAQARLLEKYPFAEGGYYLLGLQTMKGDANDFVKKQGEFYIDDLKTLLAIQKDWAFSKESPRYACGYHYEVFVCKAGKAFESFQLNLGCKMIEHGTDYFYFAPEKLTRYQKSMKKLHKKIMHFNEFPREEALAQAQKVLENPVYLFVTSTTEWLTYDGAFSCQYTEKQPNFLRLPAKAQKELEQEIARKYPEEAFQITHMDWDENAWRVTIYSDKRLADVFDICPNCPKSAWEIHTRVLVSYQK